MRVLFITFLAFCSFAFVVLPAWSQQDSSFYEWLKDFENRAIAQGISQETTFQSFHDLHLDERVIKLDQKQPEETISFVAYKNRILTNERIYKGRQLYKRHRVLLNKISALYGVKPQYIIALWGTETNFGSYTGGFDVVRSLATLAYEGRRAELFEEELMNALQIINEGHISRKKIKGSWAGALGQNQFMPSSFLRYAVDYNQDGRKDIWHNLGDVFASTANYLASKGWKKDQRWGRKVVLPANFDLALISIEEKRPLSFWHHKGLKTIAGRPIPLVEGMEASLIAPGEKSGPYYLIYDNYHVLLGWNRSTYFATSVGLLADQIAVQ